MIPAATGKYGLKVLYDGSSAQLLGGAPVDIVAVHGIGADPDRTWTKDGTNWLQDASMLPKAVPHTRIMRFGYESQWLGREAVRQRLPLIAEQLLQGLLTVRTACERRPLVLIGHCFGGLVIEKALLTAKLHENHYSRIASSVAGIVFLGTPHGGSSSKSKAWLIATIASSLGLGERSQLLDVVDKDSETLTDLVHDFVKVVESLSIPVCCFFEQHKSDVAKPLRPRALPVWPSYSEMIVDEQSGTIDGFGRIGLPSDHFNMNRFSSNGDDSYIYVSGEVTRQVSAAPRLVNGRYRRPSDARDITPGGAVDEQDRASLQALFITDPYDDMRMIEKKRDQVLESSAAWILQDASFRTWLSSDVPSVLWLHGDPGKGKTMLAISLIQSLSPMRPSTEGQGYAILAYFFCDNKDDRRNSATAILRGIIYQILSQYPEFCFYLRAEFDKQKEHLFHSPNTVQALFRILNNIASDPGVESINIIVDALDECDGESAADFLAQLQTDDRDLCSGQTGEVSTSPLNSLVKIMVTSRNEIAIREYMTGRPAISLEQNQVQVDQAVHSYIGKKVQQLRKQKRYDETLATFVEETLLQKAEGTFLWAALASRELSKPTVRLAQTRATLAKLPSGIVPLYDRIIQQVLDSDDAQSTMHAQNVLRAMVVVKRPLTLEEIAVLADLPSEYHQEIPILEDYVDGLCGSMIDIRNDVVHFVHQSAKDYIMSIKGILSSDIKLDHQAVAIRSFAHISSRPDLNDAPPQLARKVSVQYHPLDYPMMFWLDHLRAGPEEIPDQINVNNIFFTSSSESRANWFAVFWRKRHAKWEEKPEGFTALHLVAYADLAWFIGPVLTSMGPSSLDEADSQGNTPLLWAARMGCERPLVQLLELGCDVSTRNSHGLTALFLAAAHGHTNMVQLLADAGAKTNVKDPLGWTPLHRAADQGYTDVVLCLLKNGAPIEARDGGTWTALYRAVSSGQVAVMRVLLEHGANPQVPDREGMTLLHTAAWNGHHSVLSILTSYTKDIDGHDREGWTALHHGAWNGHINVVVLLLRAKANPDAKNFEGNTPLYYAAWNGHSEVVTALIQHGAGVNQRCTEGETALQQAAWRGHSTVAKILLQAGADPDLRSGSGLTALHQAASNGQQEVVILLFDADADPKARTTDGQTAFEAAKENSYYELARYIESRGGHEPEDDEVAEEDGMDLRRTGLDVDPAIAEILHVDPEMCTMQDHGDACSSEPMKVTVRVGGQIAHYFAKLGPIRAMFEG